MSERQKARPGVQVVLRVPESTRMALEAAAQTAGCSMNQAAVTRLDSGKWPSARPAEPKPSKVAKPKAEKKAPLKPAASKSGPKPVATTEEPALAEFPAAV